MTKIESDFWLKVKESKPIFRIKRFDRFIAKRKSNVALQNKGLDIYQSEDICLTCGAKGKEHPITAYCFICDTDNWHQPAHQEPLI